MGSENDIALVELSERLRQSTAALILCQSEDGCTRLDARLQEDTVWLSQAQMVELFQRDKRTISEHLRNIFKEGELTERQLSGNPG